MVFTNTEIVSMFKWHISALQCNFSNSAELREEPLMYHAEFPYLAWVKNLCTSVHMQKYQALIKQL